MKFKSRSDIAKKIVSSWWILKPDVLSPISYQGPFPNPLQPKHLYISLFQKISLFIINQIWNKSTSIENTSVLIHFTHIITVLALDNDEYQCQCLSIEIIHCPAMCFDIETRETCFSSMLILFVVFVFKRCANFCLALTLCPSWGFSKGIKKFHIFVHTSK